MGGRGRSRKEREMGRKKGIKGMEEEGKWDGRGWRRMKMRGWKVQEK